MKGNDRPGCAWYTLDQHRGLDVALQQLWITSRGMHTRKGYRHTEALCGGSGKRIFNSVKLCYSIAFDGEGCACI